MSGWVVLVAQLTVGVAFMCAAAGKLVLGDGPESGATNVSRHRISGRRLALPAIELGLSIAILLQPTARWSAVVTLAALLSFTTVLVRRAMRGAREPCGCFGAASRHPPGPASIVRNVTLIAAATLVGLLGPPTASPLEQALLITLTAAITEAWLILELKRPASAADEERTEAQERPSPLLLAPDFTLPNLAGGVVTLKGALSSGQAVVIIFVHPQCAPCLRLLPAIGRWQDDAVLGDRCIVVSEDRAASQAMRAAHGLRTVALQEDFEVAAAYGVRGTPAVAVVHGDGRLNAVALGEAGVRAAIQQLIAPVEPDVRERSAPAGMHPTDRPYRSTLVVTWTPEARDADQVVMRALEQPPTGMGVLIVTSQPPPARWTSVAVHDPDFGSLRHLGPVGAPGAIVLDATGQALTGWATGAPQALRLIDALRAAEHEQREAADAASTR
jgi:hypothetical protein